MTVVVETVPALPEEADVLRLRQIAAIRHFLEAVAANRKAAGGSGLPDSVRRQAKNGQKTTKRAQGGTR
ncbi:MAG: hypothetical protein H0W55_11470 [Actinobacteria bacterium]|nr:hypothetical protein [Actinomycetota bacterium]